MRIGKKYIPPLVLLMVSLSGAAYASIVFSQSNPGVPIGGVMPRCNQLIPNMPAVLPGSSGALIFDCSAIEFGTNAAAFDVQAATTMRPVYGFPTGYSGCTGLTPTSNPAYSAVGFVPNAFCILPHAANGGFEDLVTNQGQTCNGIATAFTSVVNAWAIPAPSTPFPFKAAGSWDYCVEYTSAPSTGTMGSFNINWMTP